MNDIIIPNKKLILLDHARPGPMTEAFREFARTRFIGQPRIRDLLSAVVEAMNQGFFPATGPIESMLLVGPSGAGKTLAAQVLAWFLFDDPEGYSRIDGQDMSDRTSVGRLVGASPGYVGYDDPPMITQRSLDDPAFRCMVRFALHEASEDVRKDYHKIQQDRDEIIEYFNELGTSRSDEHERAEIQKQLTALVARVKALGIPVYDRKKYVYPSVLLLDEFEKGCLAYHNLTYRMIDEGKLAFVKSQNGSRFLDFRKTIIIATSNLGEEELKALFREAGGLPQYSFVSKQYTPEELDRATYRICRTAVDKNFSTPLVNRFGYVEVARPHSRDELLQIVDIEFDKYRARLFDAHGYNFPIMLRVDEKVKEYLADELSDKKEKGIRLIQHRLNKYFTRAVVNLKATEQVKEGDILCVSLDPASQGFLFWREDRSGASGKIIVVE